MNKLTKTGLISLAAAIAVAMAPQAAFAHAKKAAKKAHHHHVTHRVNPKTHKVSHRVVTHAGPSYAAPAPSYASAAEVAALRAELARLRNETKSDVKNVSERAAAADAAVEAKLAKHEEDTVKKNTVFFRGGFAHMDRPRSGELLTSNSTLSSFTRPNDTDGWYVGAGFDHRVTNDLWGMTDLVALDTELMFEYKNFGTSTNSLVSQYGGPLGGVGATGGIENKLTQFTLTASPKLKFNTGTIFTPWVIPFGLAVHVISPPSSGVTVLDPGLMVGAGGEVELMKSLVAGFDFRYHWTGDDLNISSRNVVNGRPVVGKVSIDGLTTGAYLGFKF